MYTLVLWMVALPTCSSGVVGRGETSLHDTEEPWRPRGSITIGVAIAGLSKEYSLCVKDSTYPMVYNALGRRFHGILAAFFATRW